MLRAVLRRGPRGLRSERSLAGRVAPAIRRLHVEHLEDRTVPSGEPILVVTAQANPFSSYYTEILQAEGLNAFATADIAAVSPAALAEHDVVILGEMPLTAPQVTMFSNWVTAGGNLIAMRPDKQLAGLLGLTDAASTRANAYLLVDTASGPGAGIVNETIQYHGTADLYTLNGASSVATLYATAATATANPAVTLRSIGTSGGQAAAFTYDLARSIVYTRQGNPAWSGQNRDGDTLIRSDDLFYGNASFDPQADWIDLNKVAIPQADEQQRLLANLVSEMNLDNLPLPRFWYLPRGEKAAVVMTGDDHATGGTDGQFDAFIAASPPGSSADDWSAVRGTSYIYPNSPLTNTQAAAYVAQGFEVALHVSTFEQNWTPAQLDSFYANQLAQFQTAYPGVPAPVTNRTHAITWSDYATQPKIEQQYGIRFDTNYYYFPAAWIQNRPGLFTGSGMPMRFADVDGTLIDVYQAATQMTDESGQSYPFTINALLDAALDTRGYYGVFTANMHTDHDHHPGADAIVASAQARGVPVVSARQMLTWLDGRNGSTFDSLSWNTAQSTLSFGITPAAGANGLEAMVPVGSATGVLLNLTRDGVPVEYRIEVIKGIAYAFFPGTAGSYAALYGSDSTPPMVTTRAPAPGAAEVSTTAASIAVGFSESIQPGTVSFVLRDSANNIVPGSVACDPLTNTVTFTPAGSLNLATTYTVTISGAQDHAGNMMIADSWSFTTASTVSNATIWPSTAVPTVTSADDPNPYELGVKFRSDIDGYITGIRFYKGAGNTGSHIGHLWTASGTLLGTATFTTETASGWQQADFDQPVLIQANTTYVASYFVPNGHYAVNSGYFASAGVDSGVLHALPNSAGGNGVFLEGVSGFPTSSFNSANYWVDVVFSDTVELTITNQTPAPDATGVSVGSAVTATFSRAMDPTTVNSSTFRLRAVGASSDVPATVTYSGLTATLQPNAELALNTTYQVTVSGSMTAADGTPLGSDTIWSFTTTTHLATTDTTATDFGGGTPDAGIAIVQMGDGEAVLKPTAESEFSGAALPADWTSAPWGGGGAASVSGGWLTVDGAMANTTALCEPGRSLEFVATFTGDSFQHAGFADDFNSALWAMFSTGSGGTLFARTAGPGGSIDTPLTAALLGGPHHFRIDWTTTGVTYYVDGIQVASHNLAMTNSLRPVATDFNVGGGTVTVDWVRLTPYAASGTFVSRVLDAGGPATWVDAAWTAELPAGTNVALSVRTGNTATPDGTWTDFIPVANSGAAIGAVARYLQYRAVLTTTNSNETPSLQSVTFQYAPIIAPVANDDAYSTNEDVTLTVGAPGVLGNDTSEINMTAVLVSGPSHGSLTLNPNGSFSYTPTANYSGPDSFTYQANNGQADSDIATVSITVIAINDAPVATSNSYTTNEDTPLTVSAPGVLGNDTDVDSSTLTAALVAGPSHGTLTLNPNGSFTYTPTANYSGPDSFTYRVSDGQALSNIATVSLTVTAINDAPVATSNSYTTNEDTTLTISTPGVLGNDSDVDSSTLTAVLVAGPTHGTLTLNANGSFSYTPAANYSGPDSFTYRVSDGQALSNIATVSLTVTAVNDPPVAGANSYTTAEEAALNVAAPGLLGNDSDIEGGSLTAVLVSGPSHGTLTLNANGSFSYTPAAQYNGPDSFTYRARDADGALSNVVTVPLTVTPPTLSINNVSANEGLLLPTPLTFTVTLSSPTSRTITVNYATANGTATAGLPLLIGDYTATSGTLTFTAGQTSKTITVQVTGDVLSEPNETFFVNLSSASTPLADSQGQGTILNDDNLLLVAEEAGTGAPGAALTPDDLAPIIAEATARWAAAGLDAAALSRFDVRIADLPDTILGATTPGTIWIDSDAAGHGWFIDSTPADDSEFSWPGDQGEQGRIDLLTVVAHEMGHALGLEHSETGVMQEQLGVGVRHALGCGCPACASATAKPVYVPTDDATPTSEVGSTATPSEPGQGRAGLVFLAPGDFGGWTPSLIAGPQPLPVVLREDSPIAEEPADGPNPRFGELASDPIDSVTVLSPIRPISDPFDEVSEVLNRNGVFVG